MARRSAPPRAPTATVALGGTGLAGSAGLDGAVPDVGQELRAWVDGQADDVPLPGGGRSWARFEVLADLAGRDLSLGRLAEGHLDALAILAELGAPRTGPGVYGVWAASPGELVATPCDSGWWLRGTKPFCSGAGLLSRALVVADTADHGTRLFDLDVARVDVDDGSWPAVGMADSASNRVSWPGVAVAGEQAVGLPGAYTGRIGFWWGAVGVAACWWGGARALLEVVADDLARHRPGDAEMAEVGVGWATLEGAGAALRQAATAIDGHDHDDVERARRLALVTRQVVHQACVAVLGRAAAAGGARPICLDARQARRSADLYAYLAQHHAPRDAAALGRMVLDERAAGPGGPIPSGPLPRP